MSERPKIKIDAKLAQKKAQEAIDRMRSTPKPEKPSPIIELEVKHIFESGANEIRVVELIKTLLAKPQPSSPIIDIGGDTIDLREIRKVLKHGPKCTWYAVLSKGLGHDDEDQVYIKDMPRDKFITLWKEAVKG